MKGKKKRTEVGEATVEVRLLHPVTLFWGVTREKEVTTSDGRQRVDG